MHSYHVLAPSEDDTFCVLDRESTDLGVIGWMLVDGERATNRYPVDAQLHMSSEVPGMKLPDNVRNTLNYWVVSAALRAILEREAGTPVDFHPVSIINHKGRAAPGSFFIANVLAKEDCVDRAATDADESAMAPGFFSGIYRLALDPKRISPEARLFRLKQMPSVLIVRDDLRAALEPHGLQGIRYIEMGEDCMLL
ncbi:hypothetical protein HPC49_25725 [Pyxidicoccus fallax]|uniref:Immunity MXAN-0049 protein domain-containing protein n=1 Tax=Pyxidicoccus fallax TaxID=394095 RepID=A0A848LT28_9BACT|nr:DUF1629 domain-containing protein [Pyxidicoccus fallax]NMO20772.1 hypothetical protein [Pyxidicoccus fallax]NPC81607.1 hypothetical protein [Pyxidicoccus fallax]